MTKSELVERLLNFPDDMPIMILDGFNGTGNKRELNFGPLIKTIKESDAEQCADCEDIIGVKVIVIGYGCY